MSAMLDVFAEHGIETTEEELAQAVQAAFDDLPRAQVAAVSDDEAALYDAAGLTENQDAYRRQVTGRVGRYLVLVKQSLPVTAAAATLGVTRSRIQQMISAREVWALRDGKGRWVLPEVQFAAGRLLPGWGAVARALPAHTHPLEALGLLTTPQPELSVAGQPVTIPQWLASGGDEHAAARIAASLAETGL